MNRTAALAITAALGASACTGDIDPPWQLDHERIIAVRADPPAVAAGQTSTIDALLGHKGQGTGAETKPGMIEIAIPEVATVVSPASLSDVLAVRDGKWVVTAPDEARLAAARSALQLAATAPVPLQIGVSYAGQTLVATKTVLLGVAGTNPPLAGITVNGTPPGDAELVVGKLVKVPLSIDANDVTYDVTWLTSCGTMHDYDLPQAYLKVEDDDPQSGELAVVVRDSQGGVSWQSWAIRAE